MFTFKSKMLVKLAPTPRVPKTSIPLIQFQLFFFIFLCHIPFASTWMTNFTSPAVALHMEQSSDMHGSWESLRIGLAFAPSAQTMKDQQIPTQILNLLHSAIKNMEQMIFVRRSKMPTPERLTQIVQHCQPDQRGGHDGEWEGWLRHFANGRRRPAQMPNFYLAIYLNPPEICSAPALSADVLATARPCPDTEAVDRRPPIGKMTICLDDWRWEKSAVMNADIFRHEILHALGFGMFIPPRGRSGPASSDFLWSLRKGKALARTAHYMDFAENALEFTREHFGCPRLTGIEADGEGKLHLSEYFFGNELMTPLINAGQNHFTLISALILEATFVGSKPWYRTNRHLVAQETRAFWWGRHWGCDFLERSCFDLVEDRQQQGRAQLPFCTAEELGAQLENGFKAKQICFSNGVRVFRRCRMVDGRDNAPIMTSANGLPPVSLSSQFPEIFGTRRKPVFGSHFDHFYCPMAEDLFTHEELTKDAWTMECDD